MKEYKKPEVIIREFEISTLLTLSDTIVENPDTPDYLNTWGPLVSNIDAAGQNFLN